MGPLRWPTRAVLLGALGVAILAVALGLLGTDPWPILIVVAFVVLLIAVPWRLKEYGADDLRDSRPRDS